MKAGFWTEEDRAAVYKQMEQLRELAEEPKPNPDVVHSVNIKV